MIILNRFCLEWLHYVGYRLRWSVWYLEYQPRLRLGWYSRYQTSTSDDILYLTDVTDVALTDASVKVVLYKGCKFCPVLFFARTTTEEASHSWGETFGDHKRQRLVCGKLLEKQLQDCIKKWREVGRN